MSTPKNGIGGTLGTDLKFMYDFDNSSLNDTSGNGNTLSTTDSPPFVNDKDGNSNCAIYIGDSSDRVYVNDTYDVIGGEHWSVSFWFKTQATLPSLQTVFSKFDEYPGYFSAYGFDVYAYYGSLKVTRAVARDVEIYSGMSINTWYHVVILQDGLTQYSFVNGVLKAKTTVTSLPTTTTKTIWFGNGLSGAGVATYATFDESRIYSRSITHNTTTVGQSATGEVAELNTMGVNYVEPIIVDISVTPIETSTDTVTMTLSEVITGLTSGDIVINRNASPLTLTTHYTLADLTTVNPTITFESSANILNTDLLEIIVTKSGYLTNPATLEIINAIPHICSAIVQPTDTNFYTNLEVLWITIKTFLDDVPSSLPNVRYTIDGSEPTDLIGTLWDKSSPIAGVVGTARIRCCVYKTGDTSANYDITYTPVAKELSYTDNIDIAGKYYYKIQIPVLPNRVESTSSSVNGITTINNIPPILLGTYLDENLDQNTKYHYRVISTI